MDLPKQIIIVEDTSPAIANTQTVVEPQLNAGQGVQK